MTISCAKSQPRPLGAEDAELGRLVPLVRTIAKRWRFTGHYDDLVAVALKRLWQALTRNPSLATHLLAKQARWAMQQYLRSVRPGKRYNATVVTSLDRLMSTTSEDRGLQPVAPDLSDEDRLKLRRLDAIERAKGRLPKRWAFIVDSLLRGVPQYQIAEELGISEPRVSQITKCACARLGKLVAADLSA